MGGGGFPKATRARPTGAGHRPKSPPTAPLSDWLIVPVPSGNWLPESGKPGRLRPSVLFAARRKAHGQLACLTTLNLTWLIALAASTYHLSNAARLSIPTCRVYVRFIVHCVSGLRTLRTHFVARCLGASCYTFAAAFGPSWMELLTR